jgi:hypothetical protein
MEKVLFHFKSKERNFEVAGKVEPRETSREGWMESYR